MLHNFVNHFFPYLFSFLEKADRRRIRETQRARPVHDLFSYFDSPVEARYKFLDSRSKYQDSIKSQVEKKNQNIESLNLKGKGNNYLSKKCALELSVQRLKI